MSRKLLFSATLSTLMMMGFAFGSEAFAESSIAARAGQNQACHEATPAVLGDGISARMVLALR